jgi:hypothetical protein
MTRLWPVLAAAAACATPSPATRASAGPRRAAAHRSELVLKCQPQDAEVSVDGVPQGTCQDYDGQPNSLKLGRSSRVTVKKAGFLPWQGWLQADGTRVVMDVKLTSNGGHTP